MGGTATDRKQERGQRDPFLMVAGPGFEPVQSFAPKSAQVLDVRKFKQVQKLKAPSGSLWLEAIEPKSNRFRTIVRMVWGKKIMREMAIKNWFSLSVYRRLNGIALPRRPYTFKPIVQLHSRHTLLLSQALNGFLREKNRRENPSPRQRLYPFAHPSGTLEGETKDL